MRIWTWAKAQWKAAEKRWTNRFDPTPEQLGYGPVMDHHYVKGMERPDGRERLRPVRKLRMVQGGKS